MPKEQPHPTRIRMPPRSPIWIDLRLTLESRVPFPMSPLSRTSLTMPPTLALVKQRTTHAMGNMIRSTTPRPMWMKVDFHTPVRAPLLTMASSMPMHLRAILILQEYQSKQLLNQERNSVHHLLTSWMATWTQMPSKFNQGSQQSRSSIVTRVRPVWRSSWTILLPTITFRMEDLRVNLLV